MRAALLAGLLLAVPVLAAASPGPWAQAGGPHRAGVADVYPEPDVVRTFNATEEGTRVGLGQGGAFETANGTVFLQGSGGTCHLMRVSPADGAVRPLGDDIACPTEASLTASLPAQGLLLVCVDGPSSTPLLHAKRSSDGSEAWSLGPGLQPTDVAASQGAAGNDPWGCGGIAVDEDADLMVVPYSNALGSNRIVAYRASSQEVLWSATLTAADARTPVAVPDLGLPPGPKPPGDVQVFAATLTASGVAVNGIQVVAYAQATATNLGAPYLAWFGLAGDLVGTYSATDAEAPDAKTGVFAQSWRFAADGSQAAIASRGTLVVVDTTLPQAVAQTPLASEDNSQRTGTLNYGAPAWTRDAVVVPLFTQAAVCDPRDLAHCTGFSFQQGRTLAVLSPGDGSAWLLIERDDAAGLSHDLVHLALDGALPLARVPIPLPRAVAHASDLGDTAASLFPLASGDVLVLDDLGDAAVVGAPSEALVPHVRASDDHPRARQEVRLDVDPVRGATPRQVLVGWGDGLLEAFAPGAPVARAFATPGDREARVTTVYEDGRTATAVVPIHVGLQRAAQPGWLSLAFSSKYQNYTFFGLGILVTVVGSVLTAVGVARGRRRIDRRLRELDRIQEDGRRDPFEAVRRLHDYRLARRRDLAVGHLGDTQYTVLEAHADRVLELLRQRILGRFVDRVSERFSHALDLALSDGSIDTAEDGRLASLLDGETGLSRRERDEILVKLRGWQAV